VRWYDAWVNVSHVLARSTWASRRSTPACGRRVRPARARRFDERTLKITDVNGYRSRNPRQV
jgi:hypothetical protein